MGNYQLPTKITFYPSYPLYAYASGLLNANGNIEGLSERKIYDLISLNPSNIKSFSNTEDEFVKFNIDGERTSDFFMTLGHNFKDISQSLTLTENDIDVSATQIVNNSIGNACNYNGWSLSTLSETTTKDLKISFDNFGHTKIGSFLWGKKFEFPHNVDLNVSLKVDYGFSAKKSISGKTLSTLNYDKTDKWLLDAWELDENIADTRGQATESRNGVRTWNCNLSFLQDSKMMSQNNMLNSDNWSQDSESEYSTGADGSSLHNTSNSTDFYSSVIKMTMNGHLPCVVNISESNNPDQWAIVRINSYQVQQSNPKLISYKLVLEEQV